MSFTGNSGPMQTQAFPVAHGASGSVLDRLNPALALLSKREQFDPSDNMAKSFQSKSESFEERVVYLQVFFEGALFETPNQFMTQVLFPFRVYDDVNFGWEYWHFPAMPMVRTAQHAPPIKNTFQRKRGTATMSRYAMAVEGSSEADRTTTGQTITLGKLSSMAHSANSMFELNGFRAIFKEPALMRKYFYEAQLYGVDLARKLAVELSHFDILRREPLGFQNLTDDVQQEFSETMQVRATHAIISEGSRSIFANSEMMQEYRKRGAGNQQFQDLQGDAPALQQSFAGVSLLVARRYYFDGAGFTVNPMQRRIQVGGFGIVDNFNPSCDPEQYRTRMSEAALFDVDANGGGGFQWLDTAWLVANNSRFNADGNLTAQHYELAKRNVKVANAYHLPLTDNRLDMFIYATPRSSPDGGVVFNVASHWGQMERWALMDHAVRNIAATSAVAARRRIGDKNEAAIIAGLEQIERIRRKALDADDLAFMRAAAPEPTSGPQADGNKYGAHDLPVGGAVPAGAAAGGYLPAGFGTFGGALTIGEAAGTSGAYNYIDQNVRDTFQAFLPAVTALFAAYNEIYHRADPQMPERAQQTHPALLARYAPDYYKSASPDATEAAKMNAMLAFGYNVLTEVHLPVYLARADAAAVPAGELEDLAPGFQELDGANDDIDDISSLLQGGAPLILQNAFGTNAAATAFRTSFNASAFADAYDAYMTASRVRTRGAAVPGADAFARFVNRELLGQGRSAGARSAAEQVRLLTRVVGFVNGDTAPQKITTALLDSYAGEAPSGAAAAAQSPAGARTLYLTRLSVPFERLIPGVQLASPIDSSAVLASADDLARAAAAGDLARTVIFSGARAGERRPLRQPQGQSARSALFGAARGAPAFAGDVATDALPGVVASTARVTNKNLAERWAAANALANPLLRAATKMFLAAPITRAVVCSFAANHIALPLAHIVARPHKNYSTDAVVYLSVPERRPIAFTAVHDPRVNYIYDGITEKYIVHLVLYTESVLTHGQSVIIVPDARVSGYHGGDNLVPYSTRTYKVEDVRKGNRSSPSAIVMAMPSGSLHGAHRHVGRAARTSAGSSVGGGEHLFGNVFDIRGRWGRAALGNKGGAQSTMAITGAEPAHTGAYAQYSAAFFYTYLFGFDKLKSPGVLRECRIKTSQEYDNTVVLQERQLVSVNGGGTPDAEIPGCDHFKDATENGCRGRRIGTDNSPYSNIYRPLPQLPA